MKLFLAKGVQSAPKAKRRIIAFAGLPDLQMGWICSATFRVGNNASPRVIQVHERGGKEYCGRQRRMKMLSKASLGKKLQREFTPLNPTRFCNESSSSLSFSDWFNDGTVSISLFKIGL